MSSFFKGETVVLLKKSQSSTDPFGNPVNDEERIEVENVLINQTSSTEILGTTDLTTSKMTYTLAIPKNDTNDWQNQRVEFWGKTWSVVGIPLKGMDEYTPLDWNKKVIVEIYE